MSRLVTFYNNKGGVSKTTTLFNVAVYLALQGKRVLIADCDPQCNATEMFFASRPEIDDPDYELPGTTIYQAMRPRFEGDVSKVAPETVQLVESTQYRNLFLLRGDLEFSLAERYFATAASQAITEETHQKKTYVALYRMLHELGGLYSFDFVLCDVGPSTGAITQMVVLACDSFFLPLIPDRFCHQAIDVLAAVLRTWLVRHELTSDALRPFGVEPFLGKPVLIGAIIQNFKIHSGAKAKKSYERWQIKIAHTLREAFIDKQGLPIGPALTEADGFVANIRDVGALAPVAQMFGRAMFDVEREHTREASTNGQPYSGVVWDDWVARMQQYEAEIGKIADAIR